ncbi:MAG: helix-hairpin-helix domain-containing protein [Snowella sp.]|nr:helix-hairpin-helix domain-containing protein [Snowella sp.]
MKKSKRNTFWALITAISLLSACNSNQNSNSTTMASSSTNASATPDTMFPSHTMGKKININNAILSELDKLEAKLGVPALSNKIQASRPYGSVDELVSKNVITQDQLSQIQDLVTVEDIVLAGKAKDIDYLIKLGLMKGHLIVAQELLAQGNSDQAEPHIGHPVEEIYADVEDQLSERKVPEFKTTLITLQDLVKAGGKDKTKVDAAFTDSVKAIDTAIAALPATELTSPDFILPVINGLLDTANSEYGAAVINGKVSAPIEYQDSRGFVIYADQLYKGIAPQLQKADPKANKSIQANLIILKTVWPSVNPPATPVKAPEQVSKLIKEIEETSQVMAQK